MNVARSDLGISEKISEPSQSPFCMRKKGERIPGTPSGLLERAKHLWNAYAQANAKRTQPRLTLIGRAVLRAGVHERSKGQRKANERARVKNEQPGDIFYEHLQAWRADGARDSGDCDSGHIDKKMCRIRMP